MNGAPHDGPRVSVVLSTYNRSNVLRLAIESVLAQTLSDFELVVVGDACTDDTEAVVRSFGDHRIRWVSLGRNFGEQSGPNNVGALLARSELLAYLNHDDLFFPDHLAVACRQLERTGADLVFTRMAIIGPVDSIDCGESGATAHSRPSIGGRRWVVDLHGVERPRRWWLSSYQPASSWLCRREVVERLGGWRPASAIYSYPSQELLFRARRAGFALVGVPELTVLALPSSFRARAYAERLHDDSEIFAEELAADPSKLREVLLAADDARVAKRSSSLRRARSEMLHRAVAALGVNPKELRYRLRGYRPGEFIAELRRRRGLE